MRCDRPRALSSGRRHRLAPPQLPQQRPAPAGPAPGAVGHAPSTISSSVSSSLSMAAAASASKAQPRYRARARARSTPRLCHPPGEGLAPPWGRVRTRPRGRGGRERGGASAEDNGAGRAASYPLRIMARGGQRWAGANSVCPTHGTEATRTPAHSAQVLQRVPCCPSVGPLTPSGVAAVHLTKPEGPRQLQDTPSPFPHQGPLICCSYHRRTEYAELEGIH